MSKTYIPETLRKEIDKVFNEPAKEIITMTIEKTNELGNVTKEQRKNTLNIISKHQLNELLGISRQLVDCWKHKTPDLYAIMQEAYNRIEKNLIDGAASGRYKESFVTFLLKSQFGYKEVDHIKIEGNGGITLNINNNSGKSLIKADE